MVKEKKDSVFAVSTIAFAALLTLVSVVVRPKKTENQYAWSVVYILVFSLMFKTSKGLPLLLGFAPVAVNHAREFVAKRH